MQSTSRDRRVASESAASAIAFKSGGQHCSFEKLRFAHRLCAASMYLFRKRFLPRNYLGGQRSAEYDSVQTRLGSTRKKALPTPGRSAPRGILVGRAEELARWIHPAEATLAYSELESDSHWGSLEKVEVLTGGRPARFILAFVRIDLESLVSNPGR
jgi:hypothetical protein